MKSYTAVVERDLDTGLYVGYMPGFPGVSPTLLRQIARDIQLIVEEMLEQL